MIPARGGSKGIPGKNLARVGGRRLVERAIDAALGAEHVDRVVVSTDDRAIAAVAERAGAEVVERPDEFSGDTATSESALLHALDAVGATDTDVMAFLQCTSPFVRASDVDAVVRPVLEDHADSTFAATSFHGFVWRPATDEAGAEGVNHDSSFRPRRQDRDPEHLETGAVYASVVGPFRQHGHRFHGRIVSVPLDARRSIEIDEPADLELARAMARVLDGNRFPLSEAPRLVALDFDGVFTDNRVIVDERGVESVVCHRGDGHGLSALQRHCDVVVLSTEVNPVVSARCDKLGLPVVQGLGDGKVRALKRYVAERGHGLDDVVFVGNDVNDLECLRIVGTPVAVADAVPEVLDEAVWTLRLPGGAGALRELCDAILPLFTRSRGD